MHIIYFLVPSIASCSSALCLRPVFFLRLNDHRPHKTLIKTYIAGQKPRPKSTRLLSYRYMPVMCMWLPLPLNKQYHCCDFVPPMQCLTQAVTKQRYLENVKVIERQYI